MDKIKKYKEIIIIVSVIVLGAFYWFQLRPVMIKRNCSWTTEITPADSGITKEQAEMNKNVFDQSSCNTTKTVGLESFKKYLNRVECLRLEKDTVERPPQPEREETTEATKNEYDLCLRQHGL